MKSKSLLPLLAGLGVVVSGTAWSQSPMPYETWAEQIPEVSRALMDDPDDDGVANLVEYAYGLDPLQGGQAGLPEISFSDGEATFSLTKPKYVVGVEYIVRVSDTVTQIEQLVALEKVSETDTIETWAVSLPAENSRQFAWSSIVRLMPPALTGHEEASRPSEFAAVIPYEIQAAFNNDTFFWRLSYPGNEGKRHEYIRYTNGAWQREGGDRRDAEASIQNAPEQGDTGVNSTIYEQRTSIMINDPNAVSNVENFGKFGCFIACHNQARHMPEWTSTAGHDTKWIERSEVTDGAADSTKVLDLWHWRGARSNPIGRSDDQYILAMDFTNATSGDDGGRKGDSGTGVFRTQKIVDGHPEFVFDPATTGGKFAFHWEDFWATPLYYMTQPDAANLGNTAPNPVILPWADAVTGGYEPSEGDTVPRRILRAGEGSRADITAAGTEFMRSTPDSVFGQGILGTWNVQMQRLLDTGHDDDVVLQPGNTYDLGFEVHLWEYTTRDHYVSFPMTLSLGSGGDVEATDLRNTGSSGSDELPDWSDTDRFPVTRTYLFQPGIATWEFLTGANQENNEVYADPVSGSTVDQLHGGADSVASGISCTSCHKVRNEDPDPPLFNAGAMEDLAQQRGGVWAPTPILQP